MYSALRFEEEDFNDGIEIATYLPDNDQQDSEQMEEEEDTEAESSDIQDEDDFDNDDEELEQADDENSDEIMQLVRARQMERMAIKTQKVSRSKMKAMVKDLQRPREIVDTEMIGLGDDLEMDDEADRLEGEKFARNMRWYYCEENILAGSNGSKFSTFADAAEYSMQNSLKSYSSFVNTTPASASTPTPTSPSDLNYSGFMLDYDGLPIISEYLESALPHAVKREYLVNQDFVRTLRMSSPYINLFRGTTFVIHIPYYLFENKKRFVSHIQDIALIATIGIRIVLVVGADEKIYEAMNAKGFDTRKQHGQIVIPKEAMSLVKQISGKMLFEVEACLTRGLYNAPLTQRINVVSGNFYAAQPVGVIQGVDFGNAGKLRRLETESINRRLSQNDVVLLSNVGFSPSGEVFHCESIALASQVAGKLTANKLVYFIGEGQLYHEELSQVVENMAVNTAAEFLEKRGSELSDEMQRYLDGSIQAINTGVRRAHLLNGFVDGCLALEVFHRDGIGLLIRGDAYEGIRPAELKDLNGIIEILEPLEKKGILVPRRREALEADLGNWVVVERDGMVTGCAAFRSFEDDPNTLELAPLAIHPAYRSGGKGNALLSYMERTALAKGKRRIFILSTVTFEWFLERGFVEGNVKDLPPSRAANYNVGRKSKVFFKPLSNIKDIDNEDMIRL